MLGVFLIQNTLTHPKRIFDRREIRQYPLLSHTFCTCPPFLGWLEDDSDSSWKRKITITTMENDTKVVGRVESGVDDSVSVFIGNKL